MSRMPEPAAGNFNVRMAGSFLPHPQLDVANKGKKGGGSSSGKGYSYRSSETGEFVTRRYAEKHPRTTEKERRK